ncbi:MAG: hypothetical protein RL404_2187, partial [Pseudomonadota bacterium]
MRWPTHDVTNQPPPLAGINLFDSDPTLVAALRRETGDGAGAQDNWPAHRASLRRLGAMLFSEESQALAEQANRHPPELL